MVIRALVGREIAGLASSMSVRLILLASVVVAIVGGTVAAQDFRNRREQFDVRSTQLRQALATGVLMSIATPDHGLRALRPPEAGALLARGVDPSMPTWWEFDPAGPLHGPPDASQADESQSGAVLDLEGLVRVFLSLLAIVVGFEAVAGDRQSGVLQSTLNQPVSHRVVIAAKLLSGCLVLGGAVALAAVAFLATVSVVTPGAIDRAVLELAPGMGLISVLYLSGMMSAAMFIGSAAGDPASCTVALAAVWVYVSIVAPQLAVFGSRAWVPLPSRPILEIERQQAFDERYRGTQALVGISYRTAIGPEARLGDSPPPTPDAAGISDLGKEWRSEAAVTRQIVEAFDVREAKQDDDRARVRWWFTWLSPASLLFDATANLADTGEAARSRWRDSVWAHQRDLNAAFFDNPPRVALLVPGSPGQGRGIMSITLHGDVHARDLKPFDAAKVSWADRARASLPEVGGLLAYLVVGIGLTVVAFPKAGV